MARDWRSSALAALAAAVLGAGFVLGPVVHAADDDADGEPAQSKTDAERKGGKKRQDPAEAQRVIDTALKQVQAGRPELALPALTTTLAGGNLPPAIMAKAFYVRGMAFRQQGRPAQAISDLNSALWLKGGLGGDERAAAIKERAAAYADAGLGGSRDTGEESSSKTASSSGNWLSGLFGSPSPPPPPPSRPPPTPPPAAAREEAPPSKASAAATGSAWVSTTQVQPSRPTRAAAPPPAQARKSETGAAPPARSAKLEGRYQVQLGALRTEAEARALAAKARRQAALAGREAAIDSAVLGNMGTFFRVRFGPFASAEESQAVCAKLQSSGFDCLPVGP